MSFIINCHFAVQVLNAVVVGVLTAVAALLLVLFVISSLVLCCCCLPLESDEKCDSSFATVVVATDVCLMLYTSMSVFVFHVVSCHYGASCMLMLLLFLLHFNNFSIELKPMGHNVRVPLTRLSSM